MRGDFVSESLSLSLRLSPSLALSLALSLSSRPQHLPDQGERTLQREVQSGLDPVLERTSSQGLGNLPLCHDLER